RGRREIIYPAGNRPLPFPVSDRDDNGRSRELVTCLGGGRVFRPEMKMFIAIEGVDDGISIRRGGALRHPDKQAKPASGYRAAYRNHESPASLARRQHAVFQP